MSGKFFYIDRNDVFEIEKLLEDRNSRREIVLSKGDKFADVVRYSRKYDTAVFLTVPISEMYSQNDVLQ